MIDFLGWTWSKIGVDSLVMAFWNWLSQEWVNELSRYFACWCKIRKAKSYFTGFCVCIVRGRSIHLVHETLKSAVSKEWVYEFSWIFACWLCSSNFWLDQHCTLYLWLLKGQHAAVLLVGFLVVAEGPYEIGSASPFILLSVGLFSWTWIISEFWHDTTKSYQVVCQLVFALKNGLKNRQKNSIFWI